MVTSREISDNAYETLRNCDTPVKLWELRGLPTESTKLLSWRTLANQKNQKDKANVWICGATNPGCGCCLEFCKDKRCHNQAILSHESEFLLVQRESSEAVAQPQESFS